MCTDIKDYVTWCGIFKRMCSEDNKYYKPIKNPEKKMKILIADDYPDVCKCIGQFLIYTEVQHAELHLVNDLDEIIRLLNSEKYDIIISDINMPGKGDGATVLFDHRNITILMTGDENQKDKYNDDFPYILMKPFSLDNDLKPMIRSVLKGECR